MVIYACSQASAEGMEDIANTLIVKGREKMMIDIDAVDYEGKTALICACQEGNVSIAKALIQAGAKLDVKPKSSSRKKDKLFGRTALLEACYQGHSAIAEALIGVRRKQRLGEGSSQLYPALILKWC